VHSIGCSPTNLERVITMSTDAYTENLADFGSRERHLLQELLSAWNAQGLPDDFSDDRVRPAMNMNSGFVFLVNDDFQVAMMNGDKLESFYTTPYNGNEGFFDELIEEFADMHREDQDYMRQIAETLGREEYLPVEA
jgi:hypothetical protein